MRAAHDLNGVVKIVVRGWPGSCTVEHDGEAGAWVSIEVPDRVHEGDKESWTFPRPDANGVLTCFSSWLGSPGLLAARVDGAMVVHLPLDSTVTVEARPR